MNRRQYLGSLSVLATGALAGCLDDVSALRDSSGAGPQREPTVEMTRSYREADRDRRRAVGELNRVAISLEPLLADLEDEAVSFAAADPLERLETARDYLESAAATDEETAEDVDELLSYTEVLEGLVETIDAVTDDALPAELDALSEQLDDRRLDTAETTVDGVRERFAAARADLDPALEALAALERDRLGDLAVVDLERIDEGAGLLDEVVAGLSALGAALAHTVSGHRRLERGEEGVEDERYADAADAFEEAAASYETAGDRSEEATGAPGGVDAHAETTRCQSGHLEDGAREFAASAHAADDPDPVTARRHEEAGRDALEAADACR